MRSALVLAVAILPAGCKTPGGAGSTDETGLAQEALGPPRAGGLAFSARQLMDVCWPAGALDGSKRLGCVTSTNGRSLCSPVQAARSAAATSSNVPPT